MSRRLLAFIGLGILGVALVALREWDLRQQMSARRHREEAHLVHIRDGQFAPNTIQVKAGEIVTWVNDDRDLHWPASDPHPTHTGVPGFDALGEISQGETWRFTFKVPGTFGYHDHAVAKQIGNVVYPRATVIVTP